MKSGNASGHGGKHISYLIVDVILKLKFHFTKNQCIKKPSQMRY